MKVGIKVMPRAEVLDSQGRAVEKILIESGEKVQACQIGKYIELEIPGDDLAVAKQTASRIAEFVLCNPLIETYSVEIKEKL